MKNYLLFLLLSLTTFCFAQTKKEILTQDWKLNKVEEFGQEYALKDNQKNDFIDFNEKGKFKGIIEGKHVEGSWLEKGNRISISVDKKLSIARINWAKVKAIEKGKLVLEYQNRDLITATLLFVPNK